MISHFFFFSVCFAIFIILNILVFYLMRQNFVSGHQFNVLLTIFQKGSDTLIIFFSISASNQSVRTEVDTNNNKKKIGFPEICFSLFDLPNFNRVTFSDRKKYAIVIKTNKCSKFIFKIYTKIRHVFNTTHWSVTPITANLNSKSILFFHFHFSAKNIRKFNYYMIHTQRMRVQKKYYESFSILSWFYILVIFNNLVHLRLDCMPLPNAVSIPYIFNNVVVRQQVNDRGSFHYFINNFFNGTVC